VPRNLSVDEKNNLIEQADRTLSVLSPHLRYVLVARWNKERKCYTPHLTSPEGFDRDKKAILLKFYYEPKLRMISYPTDLRGEDNEPEENIVSGSVDPITGRIRIIIDCEKRYKPVRPAPFKKWLDLKNMPPYSFPEDLDTIPGWSNEKEASMIQSLKNDGLLIDEAEPMQPELSVFPEGQRPEIKTYWIDILNSVRDELNLKYPESDLDRELNVVLTSKFDFENLYGVNALYELFRENPADLKQSLLQDLYFSGAFGNFSFKLKATAFLLSKGYRNAEEAVFIFRHHCLGLKKFFPEVAALFAGLFTESDFYTNQSILESLLSKITKQNFSDRTDLFRLNTNNDPNFLSNIWGRLKKVRESFTDKQSELVDLLYLGRPAMTYEETAATLGISFDSVRDREDGVILKMKNEFKEFASLSPYKDYHKNNIVIWSYIGCRHNPTAEKIHPLYRIKVVDGIERKEFISQGALFAERVTRVLGLNLLQNATSDDLLIVTAARADAESKSEPLVAAAGVSPA